jgi:hypothetical protein
MLRCRHQPDVYRIHDVLTSYYASNTPSALSLSLALHSQYRPLFARWLGEHRAALEALLRPGGDVILYVAARPLFGPLFGIYLVFSWPLFYLTNRHGARFGRYGSLRDCAHDAGRWA